MASLLKNSYNVHKVYGLATNIFSHIQPNKAVMGSTDVTQNQTLSHYVSSMKIMSREKTVIIKCAPGPNDSKTRRKTIMSKGYMRER